MSRPGDEVATVEVQREQIRRKLEEARRQLQRQLADLVTSSDPSDPEAQREAQARLRRHDREGAEELAAEFRERGRL